MSEVDLVGLYLGHRDLIRAAVFSLLLDSYSHYRLHTTVIVML
jgi:hypothetical protein